MINQSQYLLLTKNKLQHLSKSCINYRILSVFNLVKSGKINLEQTQNFHFFGGIGPGGGVNSAKTTVLKCMGKMANIKSKSLQKFEF